jgi:hypothetical protein
LTPQGAEEERERRLYDCFGARRLACPLFLALKAKSRSRRRKMDKRTATGGYKEWHGMAVKRAEDVQSM